MALASLQTGRTKLGKMADQHALIFPFKYDTPSELVQLINAYLFFSTFTNSKKPSLTGREARMQ